MNITRENVERALKCLSDNGIEKGECPILLQALCYVLLDIEIEDYLIDSDYDDE